MLKMLQSLLAAVGAAFCVAGAAEAGAIVQSGVVSGTGQPMVQPLALDQFDDMGGALRLQSVRMDLLTSVIGGYTGDGSGIPVHIFAQLDAEYSLNGELLADTQAKIDTIVPNTSENSATVFNTDTALVFLTNPADLAPWKGTGSITLDVFTEFQSFEDPAEIIFFGAGGTVRYTVTYNFREIPAPGAGALLAMGGAVCAGSRRRAGIRDERCPARCQL